MKIKITLLLFALLLLPINKGNLFAGTTGKIAGVITDGATGEPIIGANVVIQGTSFGAAADIDGNYVILNIPPGSYTVTISAIGYQKIEYQSVRVSIDLTTNLDAKLQVTSIELGETIVVTAEKPLVVKDMTSSISTMNADQIENLPVQQITDVLRLSAGIVEADGRLHIRGGRPGEVAYWVDGISTTDVYDGRIGITVENSAVQELQVISGTFNAEYGQAMSGIVNIITKEGSKEYTGQIKVYGGDYVSSDKIFSLYKTLNTEQDPVTGLTRIVDSERDYPLDKINPIYNGEFSLSGPVPLLGDNFTFFTNGRYFYDEGYFYGREWYRPSGAPGNNDLVAMNPNERTSLQGKLNYKISNDIRVSYNLFWNKYYRERNYYGFGSHDYKYVPNGLPQARGEGYTHLFTINHILNNTTFYELRLSRYYSESQQYVYKDATSGIDYLVTVVEDTAKGIVGQTFDPDTDEGKALLDNIILLGGKYDYIPDPNGPNGYINPNTINQPTSYSFRDKGMDVNHSDRSTAYWIAKFDFTSQLNKTNQFKFGGEARFHELELHNFSIIPKSSEDGQELVPFQPAIPELGNINRNDYNRKPSEFSVYVQDKLEFYDIILNVGLRYDYFDANSVVPTDPSDPNIYAPFKNKNVYKGWVDMPSDYQGTLGQYINEKVTSGQFQEYSVEERRAFMHKEVDAKTAFSPRLGIAFPITDRGVIHFSYGHFFQIPEFQYLYSNPDFKLTSGSGETLFGNADLNPQKTVMYELGLQQQITEDIGLDLTLFYRDVRDWVGTSPLVTTAKTAVKYSVYENKDYENVKGVTLKIEKRFSNNYSFRADYTFQSAEGTYSDPSDAYNAALDNQAPVLALVPMNWDQRHTLNAQIIYDLADWTFSLIGRYWSGQPYTPSFPASESVGASAVTGLTNNSARLPAQKSIDLTINRSFDLFDNFNLELFVNVYNLLDQRDETNVYADTGTAEYTTNIDPSRVLYNQARVSTVEDFVLQPSWYTGPRQIQVGLILGF